MAEEQTRYSRLAQITKLINTELDLREVLEHVVTAISEEIMRCDSVGIYLPREDGTYQGYVGKPALINGMTLDMHIVDPAYDSLAKEVIDTHEAIYIPDTSKDNRPDQRAVQAFKINSLLVAPISYENELYGLVFLFDYGTPMNLSESEIESVKAYVNMAAVAIRNANNLTRKEKLISEKQLLLNVTRDLSLCSSLQEALDKCFHYLGEVLENPNIGAHFVDPVAEYHLSPASLSKNSDWSEEDWKATHKQMDFNHNEDLLFQEVVQTKTSIMIPDVFDDPRTNKDICEKFGMKGLYMIPLVSLGEVLGAIAIVNLNEPNKVYPDSVKQLAESIVDTTAPVLFNLLYMEKQEMIIHDRTSELTKKNEELEGAITELKKISREKELILQSAGEGIFGLDLNGRITFANPSATSLLGYENEEDIIGAPYSAVFQWESVHTGSFIEQYEEQKNLSDHDHLFYKKDGDTIPVEYVITPKKEGEWTIGYVVTFKDVTARKQMEEKIKYHAYYDSVTNVPNRVLFEDRLSQALTYAALTNKPLAILFLDLDRFKKINDTFGHSFGDQVLRKVAKRLQKAIPKEATVSRQGGDEFIILLPTIEKKEEAISCAKKILQVFDDPFVISGQEIAMKTSIGVSIFPESGDNAETLIKQADVAMYKAKEFAGNCYQLFSSDIENQAVEQIQLENDLFKALQKGNEFELYYQPKFDARTNDLIGMESLIRWNHPELGTLSPGHFIPLAEETGLITLLGEWVIRQACKQMKIWEEAGYTELIISANLSPQQFNQKEIVQVVADILHETDLPPYHLELELTENLIIHNTEQTLKTIGELKGLGIQISIDDFGTGYSSLGYLKDFPVDTLKIDKSFIDDVTTNKKNAAITKTIITLADSLGVNVIAEGVEQAEQAVFLAQHGCHWIQGFYYSQPLPTKTFERHFLKSYSQRS
ncbi:PAS domain S-box-containing protein/diguanylate cyclase (GGDEF) domain-containing protein [Halobacillus dabanensis]|uniref:PAS domain S-box-containing protein/diguanylate cyclase (GGDEF) domain-containing protein n=1 Tax=Halobacillus dabanensis TaxID=240302 RepID=A0A1I3ZNU8_HALDA|nr:EAL domain-containing protein [Halobacillus dabanensis]SFK45698.1 PAS domain S-box-containing protein/diguanylate cyclase (GGDEF) domain-containing protein [Halobacillus dabanensis]